MTDFASAVPPLLKSVLCFIWSPAATTCSHTVLDFIINSPITQFVSYVGSDGQVSKDGTGLPWLAGYLAKPPATGKVYP